MFVTPRVLMVLNDISNSEVEVCIARHVVHELSSFSTYHLLDLSSSPRDAVRPARAAATAGSLRKRKNETKNTNVLRS